jgi:hypothetical protein
MSTKRVYKDFHCVFVQNIPEPEKPKKSTNKRMIYLYNGVLLSNKKYRTIDKQNNMNKSQQYYAK